MRFSLAKLFKQPPTPPNRQVVVYGRTTYCPYLDTARAVFKKHRIRVQEIMIDQDADAASRVVTWTGFRSVPTIIAAETSHNVPYAEPTPLEAGTSPRGVNRGTMITEPSADQLEAWLRQEGFLE